MNIPNNLNIQSVLDTFTMTTGLNYSEFDLGFICRYCEDTNLLPGVNIQDLVMADVETLYKNYNNLIKDAFESLCVYYTSLINSRNRVYYYAVHADSKTLKYIPFDGQGISKHLKSVKLRTSPAKNYIVFAPEYFDISNLANTMNTIAIYSKSKMNFDITMLGPDLQTSLATQSGFNKLIQNLCKIVDDISEFDEHTEDLKVKSYFENLATSSETTHFWITKDFTDLVFNRNTEIGRKNIYMLAYLTLKQNFKFYFEDERVDTSYAMNIHVLYTHRYDTFEKQLAFINNINNKSVVLVNSKDTYVPLGIGVVRSPKLTFNARAIDIIDIVNPSPIEAKLTFIKLQQITFTEEDVIPMDIFLEYLPEVSIETFKGVETKNIANKILDIFTEMQRLAIYLIKEEPVRKADLVIVQKGENYYLTAVNRDSLRVNISSKHITGIVEEGIQSIKFDRNIPMNCIMPVKAYDFLGEKQVTNADEDEISTINRHAVMAFVEAKNNFGNARAKYRKVIINSNGKGFYYYLIVLNTLDTDPESKKLYKSIKEYDSNLLKLLKFDDAGNIIDTNISSLM